VPDCVETWSASPANVLMIRPRHCPCGSGARYAACCERLHDGAQAAAPEALMRARFAAFAVGRGDFLVDTLAENHPDLEIPRDALVRELSHAKDRQRFLGLTIVWSTAEADRGEILFVAKIFERGQDRSFAELSQFVREAGGWRYATGTNLPASELPADRSQLGRDAFLALAARSSASR
jgi:SEC-C motif domain protein